MGYYYTIDGTINFKSKRAFNIIKYLLKEKIAPFDEEIQGLYATDDDNTLNFDGVDIKNYDDYVQKIFLVIHQLDKNAEGSISACGEDSNYKFEVSVAKGGVYVTEAEMVWKKPKIFKDKFVIQNVKAILNDKNLDKNLILLNL